MGIAPSKALIVTHLGEKFVNIIGPIFAQKKVEMMQHKHFVPLDVTAEPKVSIITCSQYRIYYYQTIILLMVITSLIIFVRVIISCVCTHWELAV